MNKESSSQELIEQMFMEIQSAQPLNVWEENNYNGERQFKLILSLPHGCIIYGRLKRIEGQLEMFIQDFRVTELLRNRGIGTRLLRSFAAEAKRNGATLLGSDVSSPEALKAEASVFGEDQLTFIASDFPNGVPTYKELLDNFDHYEFHEIKVDTSLWELPNYNTSQPLVTPSFE